MSLGLITYIIDEAGDLLHLFEAFFVGPGEDLTDVLGFLFLAVVDFDLVTIHFDTSNLQEISRRGNHLLCSP